MTAPAPTAPAPSKPPRSRRMLWINLAAIGAVILISVITVLAMSNSSVTGAPEVDDPEVVREDSHVLGEPGSGKETLARVVHHNSPDREKAFLGLDCAGLQPTLVEGLLFGKGGLAEAVARNFYKLMAYKDEYEVARLYTDGGFQRHLKEAFQGRYKMKFHLAPPLLAPRDPATGHLQKMTFGAWMILRGCGCVWNCMFPIGRQWASGLSFMLSAMRCFLSASAQG